jgi:benzoate-CoA ligase
MFEIPATFNLASYLLDSNLEAGRGDKVAIYSQDRQITYRQVQESANRLGNALAALGVEMENRVLLLLFDSPEFVFSFFGAMKIGAVPIPVNTMLRPPDYQYLLDDSRAKVVIVHQELAPMIEEVRSSLSWLKHVIVVGSPSAGQLEFDGLLHSQRDDLTTARTMREDVAFWQYSSGTTGKPKGTMHQHQSMVHVVESYARGILGLDEGDTAFSIAKLFFGYGLGNGLAFPFSVGASTVLMPEHPLPERNLATITRFRPTLFFGVPSGYKKMILLDEWSSYDLSSIRLCVSAGEPLPAALFKQWQQKTGLEILDGLGSTEMLHIFISNRPGEIRPGSSGKIIPGYEAKIVDDDGKEMPEGRIGNLMARGRSSALCYWNKREKTQATMRGEWIYTGDKYYRDKDGYLWCMGRSDDMIKAGGIWVSPTEVEGVMLQHESVQECAVVGRRDEDGLEKPMAYVVLHESCRPGKELEEELKTFVRARIASYKYPRWVEFITEIPKTATGKVQRFRLRQRVET